VSTDAIGDIRPLPSPVVVPVSRRSSTGPGEAASFGAVLGQELATARSDIASIRSEIASVRSGAPLFTRPRVDTGAEAIEEMEWLSSTPGWIEAQLGAQSTGDAADPCGWRAMSRQIAEGVIGPGFGSLFERQIQQESGFLPEVVYGHQVSSAGAEGIAQLMPQYYQHVARTDPVAGLRAGAETMHSHLERWNGDVRRALASYNAGLGRMQSAVSTYGDTWEACLPAETRQYLVAIVGDTAPRFVVRPAAAW